MNRYQEMTDRQQAEVDNFPIGAAYSNSQFRSMMENWGLNPDDAKDRKKIVRIASGVFIRKEDLTAWHDMADRHMREYNRAIAEDKTGDGFIYEMFSYELNNHEFGYTGDMDDTLEALGLTWNEVISDERLKHGMSKAAQEIMGEDY